MTVKLRDRHHLHLVLLAGLRDGPASGRELAYEVGRRSGGRIGLDSRTVYVQLHHLARNGLVTSEGLGRYRLTESGTRSLRHRERVWEDYVAAVDAVRTPEGPGDPDGHRAVPEPELRAAPSARRAARSPR